MKLSFKAYGRNGILVQWPKKVSKDILNEMNAFIEKVQGSELVLKSIYHTYQEVYIEFNSPIIQFDELKKRLTEIYSTTKKKKKKNSKVWTIPVCYDIELIPDLELYLTLKNLTIDDFISLHTTKTYLVHFTGFLPGFLYLGGLDAQLELARKATPSRLIKKGTVAIGGSQTGIYPQDSPGGWYGVGYTPVALFDPYTKPSCFASAGDYIQFNAISRKKLSILEKEISNRSYSPKCIDYEG